MQIHSVGIDLGKTAFQGSPHQTSKIVRRGHSECC